MGAAALIGVGAGLQIFGNIKSNFDQAKAEKRNAQAYEEQAAYAREVNKRKMELLERQQRDFVGKQKALFAGSGVSFSGSVLDVFDDTTQQQELERVAAQMEGEQNVMLYTSRAQASRDAAKSLRDPFNILLPAAGTALTTYGTIKKG
jgi:hypothetical protein